MTNEWPKNGFHLDKTLVDADQDDAMARLTARGPDE